MKEYYDVIIVGTGAAGLYCALNLPERKRILLITKQEADHRIPSWRRVVSACFEGKMIIRTILRTPCVPDIMKTMPVP